MNSIKIHKAVISFGILIMAILPMYFSELYISKTGHMSETNLFLVVLAIIGIYKNWRFTKLILLILTGIVLIATTLWCISGFFAEINNIRPGSYINLILSVIVFISLIKLRKGEKI